MDIYLLLIASMFLIALGLAGIAGCLFMNRKKKFSFIWGGNNMLLLSLFVGVCGLYLLTNL